MPPHLPERFDSEGGPPLVLPLKLEQRMLSARVMEMGAGLAAPALAPEGMR